MDDDLDLRGTIEAALDEDTGGESVVADTPAEAPAAPVAAPAPDTPAEGGEKVRDALGRFVEKVGDTAKAGASSGGTPAQAQPGQAALPGTPAIAPAPDVAPHQAPTSWGPAVREHWGALPPAVQEQIANREMQFQHAFRDAAPLRNTGEAFMQAVQPFQMAIQAEGVDPITAVRNLMQIGTTLRFGTPLEKATTVAKLVQAYGVDIQQLDGALVGAVPEPSQGGVNPQMVQQLVQQQLQPLFQAAQQREQAMHQQSAQQAQAELQAFASDPKHEFFSDVRALMADMIEVASRQGFNLPLADAYQRAASLHPEVSKVMMARQQGLNAQALTKAARTARAASVSVTGKAPVGNPGGREPSSVRESIEAAIEAHDRY
jgi:hypothetical protein